MPKFEFIATDSSGRQFSGTIEAADRSSAIANIRAQGYMAKGISEIPDSASAPEAADARAGNHRRGASRNVGKSKEAKSGAKKSLLNLEIKIPVPKFLRRKVKQKELTAFTRQLATLVNAGLPLMKCIEVLRRQCPVPALKECLDGVSEQIAGGSTFSEALTGYPKIFDNLYVNMVKAGEAGGVLEIVLTRLAEFSEKAAKIINKVKSAMVYPVVVLVAAIGITAFLLIKAIPQFQGLFKDILGGKQLPAVTQFVIDASEFVQENGLSILLGVIAFVLALKFVKKTSYGAYYWDALKLRAPVIGTLLRRTAISRFSRTLGTLLASGVPILQSLTIVRDTAGNKVLSKAIQNIHDAVKEGESMTGPLAESKVFPPMVVSMVEVGEETGALSDMLTRVANTYDDEVDNAVAGLTAAIEPALIIFLASIVGTIVVAMFMPMISIIQGMSGGAGTGM